MPTEKRPEPSLSPTVVTQALWHWWHDPVRQRNLPAIGSLRYYRFPQRARLATMTLQPEPYQPAQVALHAWSERRHEWQAVFEAELPALKAGQAHRLRLGGVVTRVMRVECLRHHPLPPSSGDAHASPSNPPYDILRNVTWQGSPLRGHAPELPLQPPLRIITNHPRRARGLAVFAETDQVQFSSRQFTVGFSLRRPLVTHLGWDSARTGKAADNLLYHRIGPVGGELRILSGPVWNTLDWDCHARLWGGTVSVTGNVVRYQDLCVNDELFVDAEFTVRPDGLDLRLVQRAATDRETIGCEPWRFVWNGRAAATATLGLPRQDPGRTGAVDLPALWAAPGYGNLSCCQVSGDPARLQVDTWRQHEIGWAGFVFGHPGSYPPSYRLAQRRYTAEFELRVADLVPKWNGRPARSGPRSKRAGRPFHYHPEIRRNWGPGLMFRAELAGFSNNALSTNCHLSQTGVTDLAAYTAPPVVGPKPIELARYTAALALRDGRGYGDCRDVYQDSDPSILNMTGRIHQVAPDAAWLRELWPFIRGTTDRILAKIDRRGLVVAPLSTGNYGSKVLPANGWDCVNMGHYDAYSNVETYRALRNVTALGRAVGADEFAAQTERVAERLRRTFVTCFYNPRTGWFGSWRSKDGELHDYAHLCVNAPACLYGIVSPARARRILARLDARRLALGLDNFRYGLPSALVPIRRGDYVPIFLGAPLREDGADAFGIYCNGTLTLGLSYYYLRAMTVFGFRAVADQMAREILEGHALGRLVGGVGTGVEFHTFEGIICGYEGAYVLQFPTLLAIAQHRGWVKTLEPEFWPAATSAQR